MWALSPRRVDGSAEPVAAVDHDDIEQGFGDGVGAPAPARDDAHGAVAVTGEAGLTERGGQFDGSDAWHARMI